MITGKPRAHLGSTTDVTKENINFKELIMIVHATLRGLRYSQHERNNPANDTFVSQGEKSLKSKEVNKMVNATKTLSKVNH